MYNVDAVQEEGNRGKELGHGAMMEKRELYLQKI